MRIALDATYSIDPHPSGIAIYSRKLMTGLARMYPQWQFCCCYRPKQFWKALRPDAENAVNRLLLPPLPTFRADLFHALNQRVDRRPAKHVISTFHDLFVMTGEYSSKEFRERFTKQAREAAARSDRIIAVSQFTADQVSSLLQFEPSRISVVPHGVDLPAIAAPVPVEPSPCGRMILFAGAIQARKNVERLVEAFEQALATVNRNDQGGWRLVLAGAVNGYGSQRILDRIDRSKFRDRITVTGYVSDEKLRSLYSRATVFAFPSLDEGFGIPVLEAMAHGTPVITSDGSALKEVAGDAAVLVDPKEVDQIAEAFRYLMNDTELREQLGSRGRIHARAFSWERTIQSTYRVYQELLR